MMLLKGVAVSSELPAVGSGPVSPAAMARSPRLALRESDPACPLTPRPLSIRHGASPAWGGLFPVPGGSQLLAALAAAADQKPGPRPELLESTLSGGSFCCAGREASRFPRAVMSGLVAGAVQGADPPGGRGLCSPGRRHHSAPDAPRGPLRARSLTPQQLCRFVSLVLSWR